MARCCKNTTRWRQYYTIILAARVNPLGKNTTLGETLRHRVALGGLAQSRKPCIILYMDRRQNDGD